MLSCCCVPLCRLCPAHTIARPTVEHFIQPRLEKELIGFLLIVAHQRLQQGVDKCKAHDIMTCTGPRPFWASKLLPISQSCHAYRFCCAICLTTMVPYQFLLSPLEVHLTQKRLLVCPLQIPTALDIGAMALPWGHLENQRTGRRVRQLAGVSPSSSGNSGAGGLISDRTRPTWLISPSSDGEDIPMAPRDCIASSPGHIHKYIGSDVSGQRDLRSACQD